MWISRLRTKANSIWLKAGYPFYRIGRRVSVHHSCDIRRSYSHKIALGNNVLLDREVWLNIPVISGGKEPTLIIGDGTNIGRRSVISAKNHICIQENVLFGPSVFVTDHNHEYTNPDIPISEQGVTRGGEITIERNCWLGYGSMILAGSRAVVIGRNSIVGAYSLVTESCPAYSVLVGSPAMVVKQYDPVTGEWMNLRRGSRRP